MTRSRMRILWWSITGLYLLFTYATLGMAPPIWNTLNKALGNQGVILIYVIYAAATAAIGFYFVAKRERKKPQHYILLVLFMAVFFLMLQQEKNPGEKIHMAQYGVLGIFLYKALAIDFDRYNYRLYLNGAAISLMAGEVDEIIQGLLPNRWFTWHDVFINGFSGILTLLIIRILVSGKVQEYCLYAHNKITCGERILMGVLSCWPGLHLIFLGVLLALQAIGKTIQAESKCEDLTYPLLLLALGWCIVLVPGCMLYMWKAISIRRLKKYLWFLLLIAGNMVVMPIFYCIHIWQGKRVQALESS